MFTGQTVWTIIGGLAGLDTTMWVSDLVIVLSSKPTIQIVTVDTVFPILVTQTPVRLEELFVELTAGGVDGEHLV